MEILHFFQKYWAISVFVGTTLITWGQMALTLKNQKKEIDKYMKKVEGVEVNQNQVLINLAEMRTEMRADISGLRRDVERVINSKNQ